MEKRLYKNDKNKHLAGVCQGIAEYFNLDPSMVRLAFVIAVMIGSAGFWVYVILAIVLPDKSEVFLQRDEEPEIYDGYDDY